MTLLGLFVLLTFSEQNPVTKTTDSIEPLIQNNEPESIETLGQELDEIINILDGNENPVNQIMDNLVGNETSIIDENNEENQIQKESFGEKETEREEQSYSEGVEALLKDNNKESFEILDNEMDQFMNGIEDLIGNDNPIMENKEENLYKDNEKNKESIVREEKIYYTKRVESLLRENQKESLDILNKELDQFMGGLDGNQNPINQLNDEDSDNIIENEKIKENEEKDFGTEGQESEVEEGEESGMSQDEEETEELEFAVNPTMPSNWSNEVLLELFTDPMALK